MINVLGLALYGPLAASHRVRLANYRAGLLQLGINLEVHSLLGDDYLINRFSNKSTSVFSLLDAYRSRLRLLAGQKRYDAAIVHCELLPIFPYFLERGFLSIPYIYDFDDAFYLRYRTGKLRALQFLLGEKFDSVIAGAAAVTAGNNNLAQYAQKFNSNTIVLPSVVDTEVYTPRRAKKSGVFTIGWVGSSTTAPYLKQLISPLKRLGGIYPVRFVVVGGRAPVIDNVEVVEIPWCEGTEVEIINSFDVGVMPLPDDEWAKGKCAFKLIQYMACGIPVVASRVGANIDVVSTDAGFLASTDDEWFNSLDELRCNTEKRNSMGVFARKKVESNYSLVGNLPRLVEVIKNVLGRHDGRYLGGE